MLRKEEVYGHSEGRRACGWVDGVTEDVVRWRQMIGCGDPEREQLKAKEEEVWT